MRIVGLLVVLAACATPRLVWKNPRGIESFKIDWYECSRDARTSGLVRDLFVVQSVADIDDDFRKQCMEARGWNEVEVPAEVPSEVTVQVAPAEVEGLKKVE